MKSLPRNIDHTFSIDDAQVALQHVANEHYTFTNHTVINYLGGVAIQRYTNRYYRTIYIDVAPPNGRSSGHYRVASSQLEERIKELLVGLDRKKTIDEFLADLDTQ